MRQGGAANEPADCILVTGDAAQTPTGLWAKMLLLEVKMPGSAGARSRSLLVGFLFVAGANVDEGEF